jgi:cytochrome P450
VLALTIFSDGLQSDPDEFRLSMTQYFRAAGRIGLLDLIGAPDYIPRPGRSQIKSTLRYFENIIDGLIDTRRRLLENHIACRDDLLTLLLRALDPATGQPMTPAEVRSNMATIALACLIHRFEFRLENESQVWPQMSVTVRPANGLRMRIAPAARMAERDLDLAAGSAAE